MFKKLMLIGILTFSLIALSQIQAAAWSIPDGGWGCCGTYTAWFDIRGGGNPGDQRFFGTQIFPLDACLVCLNASKTNRKDVREGVGGITIISYQTEVALVEDENGRTILKTKVPSGVWDLDGINPDPDEAQEEIDLCNTWEDPESLGHGSPACDAQDTFEYVFGVSNKDCRNDNWLPYEAIIRKLKLIGDVVEDCTDPNVPPDPATCTEVAALTLYCETKEPCRETWEDLEYVYYICVDDGAPVAWDDSYSVMAHKALKVRDPGVLINDSVGNDQDHTVGPLKAFLVDGPGCGDLGPGGLSEDGGFTYTYDEEKACGDLPIEDSFTYKVKDIQGDYSNIATVKITVE